MSDAPPTDWPQSLSTEQIAELKASGIRASVAHRMGVYGIDDAKEASRLLGRTAKQWEEHLPAIVYPYYLPAQRDAVLFRGKPSKPFETTDPKSGKITRSKYVQPYKTGTHVYLGPSILFGDAGTNTAIPILGTEGEKKGLAGESAGFATVALAGVHQWHVKGTKELHPAFAWIELKGREFFLCFDADAMSNADVRAQELEFGRVLAARGAKVYVVRFPDATPKLDDFLAVHTAEDLLVLLDDARKRAPLPPDTRTAERASEEWKPVLERLRIDDESRAPIRDVDNVARVLMHHPAWVGVLAFDSRRERQVFAKQPPFAADVAIEGAKIPRPVIDTDVTRIGDWLANQSALGWALSPKPNQLEQAIALVCERQRVDSVRDYLRALPAWDQTPRLAGMGPTYFGSVDTPYARTVFPKWMLSAVARARNPGCQVDHVLVLEGPQGLGKSTALRILAGDANFSDTLPELGRDAHEHCLGPWIVELAELDHMRRAEVTSLKAFLSTRAPAFRSAYGKRTMDHPRRCVFAATTNDSGYLADSTGGRRFWPVECTAIDGEGLRRDRDQLWAEALHRIRAGEEWHITDPDVRDAAVEEQAARRQVDPWQPMVARFVHGRRAVTVNDVLDHLGHGPEQPAQQGFGSYQRPNVGGASGAPRDVWRFDQRSANRVASILRELGWVRRNLRLAGGGRAWSYVRDEPTTAPPRAGSTRGATGTTVEPPQQCEITGLVPVVPVVPLDPATTHAGARDAGADGQTDAPTRAHPSSNIQDKTISTGTSGTTGTNVTVTDTCDGSTVVPVQGGTGTTPPQDEPAKPKRRRF